MPNTPLTTHRLQGTALAIIISTVFGAVWGLNGSAALVGGWRWVAAILVIVMTIPLFQAAYTFRRAASKLPSGPAEPEMNPFRTRTYGIAVAAQFIAIPIAGRLLASAGYDDAIMPVIAIIVGLHLVALVPAFRSRHFAWVGGALCILALAALALPAQVTVAPGGSVLAVRNAVVGFGCAIILWLSMAPIIMTTYRQCAAQRA